MDDLGMRNCRLNYLGGGRWIVAYQIITGPETARTLSIPLTFDEAKVIARCFCNGLESVMQARDAKGKQWQETNANDKKPTSATSTSPGTLEKDAGKSVATSPMAKGKSSISGSAKSERSACKMGSPSSRSNSAQRSTAKGSKGKGGKAKTTKAVAAATDKVKS